MPGAIGPVGVNLSIDVAISAEYVGPVPTIWKNSVHSLEVDLFQSLPIGQGMWSVDESA